MDNDNFYSLARDTGESLSEVGKFFGILTYGFLAFICALFIGLFINLIINNNKYMKTTGYVVQSFPCTSTDIYDSNGKKVGTNKVCPTVVRFKTNITPPPSNGDNSFSLPPLMTNSPQLPLGFNQYDGSYYQRFELSVQYSVGDTINIYYLENDVMNSATTSLFPNLFMYLLIGFFVIGIIYCLIMLYAITKLKAYSTAKGARYVSELFK